MHSYLFLSFLGAFLPSYASAAFLENWEGAHIDTTVQNRAVDWWYTQVIGQTPAANGIPPSIEVVLKHGNVFEFGNVTNTPLFSVEFEGFDLDGKPFGQILTFNTSRVAPTGAGLTTVGFWSNTDTDTIGFYTNANLSTFTIVMNTPTVTGSIVIHSNGHFRTGCGGTETSDSPFFDSLVVGNNSLTEAEVILYKETGWRITAPGGTATVNLNITGTIVDFVGTGYKDSNWSPNAINDFIQTWYVIIAEVGPYSFVTFTGKPVNGTHIVNSGHLSYNGKFIMSTCDVVGERTTDITIITPSGEIADSGVTAPTQFNITFVLADGNEIAFQATNIVENPSVSFYHRWVAQYVGGAPGENYTAFGITEWMNPQSLPQYEIIQ